MKLGILSLTWISPLTKPSSAPTRRAVGIASQAQLANVPPQPRNAKAKSTAQTEIVPSIERSMEPMMMMKVTPTATMSAGAAAMPMRAAFRMEKNRESRR